jgi:glycosyltransferase involved in cell wall biosynthesis
MTPHIILPHVILDVSRLLSRAGRPVPTGIDRVELAYARRLMAGPPDGVTFAAMANWGRFASLPADPARAFLHSLDARWSGRETQARPERFALSLHMSLLTAPSPPRTAGPAVYLLLSHHHLDRTALIGRIKARTGARFCCLIHDLIPIELPEYARPGQTRRHLRRVATAQSLADGVIVNSASTARALEARLAAGPRAPPVLAAPLGVETPPAASPSPVGPGPPYFLALGTIEPKKNHLLLLNLWRRLAESCGEQAPHLVLVGQRGWMTRNVVDMLERSPPIRRLVREHNALSDAAVEPLLRGARALLLPSFAEGFGLPVAEALLRGVPVICSDLEALREAGGEAPEYLDPLDGPAWRAAILDYAAPDSPRRAAQLARIARYRPPTWDEHFGRVMPFLEKVAAAAPYPPAPRTRAREARSTGWAASRADSSATASTARSI